MKKNWNDQTLRRKYERLVFTAKQEGFTDDELDSPYLDKLSHQTGSRRIMRMVRLAYTLGQLRSMQQIDEGQTPISQS